MAYIHYLMLHWIPFENQSEIPQDIDNVYAVYRIKTGETIDDQIASINIRFKVNRSFAEQYDEIVMSRYDNGWKDLQTTRIDAIGGKWMYQATSTGFSYYAVRGENHEEDKADNKTDNGSSDDIRKPVCGNNVCEGSEDWDSCSADCEKRVKAVEAENSISEAEQQISKGEPGYQTLQKAKDQFENGHYLEAKQFAAKALRQNQNQNGLLIFIVIGLAAVALLIAAGFIGRKHWQKRMIQKEVKDIGQKVHKRVKKHEMDESERIKTELDHAEDALESDDYGRMKKFLDKVEDILG